MGTRLIFSCLRNEGPFLLEWVGYHLSLGFDRFVLFTNDCEDGTDAIADRLQALGLAQHVRNVPDKRGPQWTALRSGPLEQALAEADWAMHLDADEFVNAQSLTALTEAIGGADAISLPWRFFGSSGIARFADVPVTRQFLRCGPYPIEFPRQALMFKTLFRPSDRLSRPGVHAPRPARGTTLDRIDWRNGDGRPVSGAFRPNQPVLFGADMGNSLGQINHYALKSRESFLIKAARGLPNHGHVPVDMSYWVRRNFNDLEDTRLASRSFRDLRDEDPELSRLHQAACGWHRTRIAEILATPQGIELFSALSVCGDSVVPPDPEVRALYAALGRVFGPGRRDDG